MQPGAVLRVARPTDHLAAIAEMYATGLDFTVLAQWLYPGSAELGPPQADSAPVTSLPVAWEDDTFHSASPYHRGVILCGVVSISSPA